MHKTTISLLLLVTFLSACATTFTPGDGSEPAQFDTSQKQISGPKRGITAVFGAEAPPRDEIRGTFRVTLIVANYAEQVQDISLSLWDTAAQISQKAQTVIVDPAIQERNIYQPAINELYIGSFAYDTVIPGMSTKIIAQIDYATSSYTKLHPCITHPADRAPSCALQENFGEQITETTHYPIAITNVRKSIAPGAGQTAHVTFDFTIENLGGGEILHDLSFDEQEHTMEEPTILFDLDDTGFTCSSKNVQAIPPSGGAGPFDDVLIQEQPFSSSLTLNFDSNQVQVSCSKDVSIPSPLSTLDLGVSLHYRYRYRIATNEIAIEG